MGRTLPSREEGGEGPQVKSVGRTLPSREEGGGSDPSGGQWV